MICVLASLTVKPGTKDEFLRIFNANVPNVLAEDGCIEYAPMVDVEIGVSIQELDDAVVTVVEKWERVEQLKAHFQAPHMLSYKEQVKDIVTGVSLKVLTNG